MSLSIGLLVRVGHMGDFGVGNDDFKWYGKQGKIISIDMALSERSGEPLQRYCVRLLKQISDRDFYYYSEDELEPVEEASSWFREES